MLALTIKNAENGENEWINIKTGDGLIRVSAKEVKGKITIVFDAPKYIKILREGFQDENDQRQITS